MKWLLPVFLSLIFFVVLPDGSAMENETEYVGVATMLPDGTIVLHLRAETDGVSGETHVEYKPNDPNYDEIITHIGGIEVGEEKFVPSWDD